MVWCRLNREMASKGGMQTRADRLRRHITRQSSSPPSHHRLPSVNALVIDANDVVALMVAEQLNLSAVFGIVHHDDFLLDHDKHSHHHHDRHAADETGESGIVAALLGSTRRLWFSAVENVRLGRIFMMMNRLRVTQLGLPRLRTMSHLYHDKRVVLIQTSSARPIVLRNDALLPHIYQVPITPPCLPCLDADDSAASTTSTAAEAEASHPSNLDAAGDSKTSLVPTVMVECTFPYQATITRAEEKALFWAVAAARQAVAPVPIRFILGNRSWFRHSPLPANTHVEITGHVLESLVRHQLNDAVVVLIRRCQQPLGAPFAIVNDPSPLEPIIICYDAHDAAAQMILGNNQATAFSRRLARAIRDKMDFARWHHNQELSQRDELRWTIDAIHARSTSRQGPDHDRAAPTPVFAPASSSSSSPQQHQEQQHVEQLVAAMAFLVLALVLTAHAYLKRYPGNSFRRHLTQLHDLDETAAALTAWLMNTRRSAHDFTSQCPLLVDSIHDHAHDDDDDDEGSDAPTDNTAVKSGKHSKNHNNNKQPRGHHYHPVASTKMKRY
jgi:hypothetical protein